MIANIDDCKLYQKLLSVLKSFMSICYH